MKLIRMNIWGRHTDGSLYLNEPAKELLPNDRVMNRCLRTYSLTVGQTKFEITVFPFSEQVLAFIDPSAPQIAESAVHRSFNTEGKPYNCGTFNPFAA